MTHPPCGQHVLAHGDRIPTNCPDPQQLGAERNKQPVFHACPHRPAERTLCCAPRLTPLVRLPPQCVVTCPRQVDQVQSSPTSITAVHNLATPVVNCSPSEPSECHLTTRPAYTSDPGRSNVSSRLPESAGELRCLRPLKRHGSFAH